MSDRSCNAIRYEEQLEQMTPMEQTVFKGCLRFRRIKGKWPTAPQLHNFLESQGSVAPNSCTKARVTELKKPGRNLLEEYREEEQTVSGFGKVTSFTVRPTTEAMA